MNKLKPVIFVNGEYGYNKQNTTQQLLLLKALRVTQDPKKLKDLIGVRTVAEVYRTLDKISMRKEYHEALAKSGITFDYIVNGIKKEIDSEDNKASDRLSGLNMLLKSIGLDKYEETAIGGGGWEEALLKISANQAEKKTMVVGEYEVVEPKMPEHLRILKEKANQEAKGLYE